VAGRSETAIHIDNLSKQYRRYSATGISTVKDLFVKGLLRRGVVTQDAFWALKNVNISIPAGETYGIIGPNGSGKSTLLKLITGILKPTSGSISVNGRISALIELGAGFHPEFTGRENVYLNGVMLGMRRPEIDAKFDEIVRFAELEGFIDQPVKTYSSGMYMRLGFSVAVAVEPDVLLVDEILAVGDESFQHKCLRRIKALKSEGTTLLFVSHDLSAVRDLCDSVLWLQEGSVRGSGEASEVIEKYLESVREMEARTLLKENGQVWQNASSNRERWGTGEAEITRVRLLGAGSEERYVFESGEDVEIVVDFIVRKELSDPVIGIGIFTEDGYCVFGTNTEIDDVKIGPLDVAGAVKILLKDIRLMSGAYVLDVAIRSERGQHCDYRRRICTFVFRSPVKDSGVYRPLHRWELKPGSSAGRSLSRWV
jgi:ABC-type polysaccharide/polyol phosphate transport system ATPase subunit